MSRAAAIVLAPEPVYVSEPSRITTGLEPLVVPAPSVNAPPVRAG